MENHFLENIKLVYIPLKMINSFLIHFNQFNKVNQLKQKVYANQRKKMNVKFG